MRNSKKYFFYCLFMIANIITSCLSSENESIAGASSYVNNSLLISRIPSFNDYLAFLDFKYEVSHLIYLDYQFSSFLNQQKLLHFKKALRDKVLNYQSKRKIQLSEWQIEDVMSFTLNEIKRDKENVTIEEESKISKCVHANSKFTEYRDKKIEELLHNMESYWNNSMAKDVDPEWKSQKWNLWLESARKKFKILKRRDSMFLSSLNHSLPEGNVCYDIYDQIKSSWMDDHFKLFLFDLYDFALKSLEELNEKNIVINEANEKEKEETEDEISVSS